MPIYTDHFDGLYYKEHSKGYGRAGNQKERKSSLNRDSAEDLSIMHTNRRKTNEFLKILRVEDARIDLKE